MMLNALLTGDLGFVGRHMRQVLEADGYEVTGVDIAAPHPVDARDFFRTSQTRFDLVVHCAAIVGGRVMIDGHPLALAVDLAIDAELFSWALRTRPGKIVYFSSSAAYPTSLQGRASHIRLREDHIDLDLIQTPDAVYGWAKLTGEILARHAQAAGLDVLVVRPFSGYGHDQALDYPFPSFIDRAVRREDPFTVWGDGEQTRDFIHIDDICAAVMTAVGENVQGPVNLGTGQATSFNELARIVTILAGYAPELTHRLAAPTGVQHRVADPTRMLEFYRPKIGLHDGVARALAAASQFA